MKVVIFGSRTIVRYTTIKACIEKVVKEHSLLITEIISGGARGVDTLGENYGLENQIPIVRRKPDWKKYGISAGYRRNTDMAILCDAGIAIWDGVSRGTAHMVSELKRLGKPCYLEIVEPEA